MQLDNILGPFLYITVAVLGSHTPPKILETVPDVFKICNKDVLMIFFFFIAQKPN